MIPRSICFFVAIVGDWEKEKECLILERDLCKIGVMSRFKFSFCLESREMREEEQAEPEPDQGQESEPLSGIHSHALLMRTSTRAFALALTFLLPLATCHLQCAMCTRTCYVPSTQYKGVRQMVHGQKLDLSVYP